MSNVTVTVVNDVAVINVINAVPVYIGVSTREVILASADFNYEFDDGYFIEDIIGISKEDEGIVFSCGLLADGVDIIGECNLPKNKRASTQERIFPADTEDSAKTIVYFKTTGAVRVTIFKKYL